MATMLGFTNGLRDQLAISRNKIDTWVEHEKARVDALTMRRIHELESQQKNLDDKVAELLAIRLDSGLGDDGKASSRENDLLNEQEAVQDEMKLLVKKQEQQQTSLQELKEELKHQKLLAQQSLRQQQTAEAARKTTIDDLTRGIINYQYLGLDFEKALDNHMKFVFTMLDPDDSSRPFSFLLQVEDSSNCYQVDECQPSLPTLVVQTLEDQLNETDDMMAFCMGMRKAFEETLPC